MATVQDLINAAKTEFTCLDAQAAAGRAHDKAVLLIDLREPAEHEAAAVPVAVHIPRGVLEFKIAETCADKSAEILLQCGGGGRASLAAQSLKSLGYQNVSIVNAKFEDFLSAYNQS